MLMIIRSRITSFRKTSFAELRRHRSWLYYDAIDEGYKCKICELFPEGVVGSRGKNMKKFSDEVVKDLTDHPKRVLTRHERSNKQEILIFKIFRFLISLKNSVPIKGLASTLTKNKRNEHTYNN